MSNDEMALTVTRVIDAPPERVFRAWTDPARVAQWWGPKGFVTVDHDMDIRPGGTYRFTMRSPEGTDHRKRGRYLEIVEPERIVFTFAWAEPNGHLGHETLITVTFEPLGSRTKLTLRQANFDTAARRDDHTSGWTSCLERFADYMTEESNHGTPDRLPE
jgi:uncharacterized protein YndB with AHSA1/START domain